MTRVVRPASIVAAFAILFLFATVPAAYAEGPDQRTRVTSERYQPPVERYQIVRATEHRVWRLDKTNGEITMCTLQRDRMMCANSTDAVVAPKRSYEELQKERSANKARDRERQIATLDRMLMLFRELVAYSIEQENAAAE